MKIILKKNGKIVCENLETADNFLSRTIGLLRNDGFAKADGVLLSPCSQIHSFFMKFEFDAIYLDKNLKVKKMFQNIKSNKILPYGFGTKYVLELPATSVENAEIQIGDEFEIVD